MKFQRVERHIITNNKHIDNICFLSKNLYNYCNYVLRQVYLEHFENIEEFKDLIQKVTYKNKLGEEKSYFKIDEYTLITRLTKLEQNDYRALPSQTSQQIILLLYKNWKSFFKSLIAYHKNKLSFKGRPKQPKYKHKIKGRNLVTFTKQQCKIKNNEIKFPLKSNLESIKTKVDNLIQVRIVPKTSCYILEIVYWKEVNKENILNKDNYLAIDLGINNLATCVNNTGKEPFIVNGRIVKSINQYYNKKLSKLQSFVGNKEIKTSKRIKKLSFKRNNKIEDYFHKASRLIVDYCLENEIQTIVIGYNKTWKNEVDLSKSFNQKFVQIPFTSLIQKIQYKAEEVEIKLILNEESYTSKCSFLDLEPIKKHEIYLGRRIKRGLFLSSKNRIINADVNGSYNILRKVVPESFKTQGIEGVGLHPKILNNVKVL